MRDTRERFANALRTLCERFANAWRTICGHSASTFGHLLDPWTPTLKREPFRGTFGNHIAKPLHGYPQPQTLHLDHRLALRFVLSPPYRPDQKPVLNLKPLINS